MKRIISLILASVFGFLFLLLGASTYERLNVKSENIVLTPEPLPILSSEKLWEIVNDWRVSQNLPVFTYDGRLCDIAKPRLSEIKTDWSHDGFVDDFESLRVKLKYQKLGENLARAHFTEEGTLSSWLNSPSHKENLDDSYTHSCIATSDNFVVQIFAKY